MSLLTSIQKLHQDAAQRPTAEQRNRTRSHAKVNPNDWEILLAAIEALHPDEFTVIENAILSASKTKGGKLSTVFAVKADFPVRCTISLYASGKVYGDGIELEPIIAKFNELKTAKE